ncbi:pentapeptide repeat-containing protein [Desulforhopalus sp. IMCC35007]|uniref:pentapeptide repeat-containing protein n=1 Tax=Desulforhopalus sp. IMCC35007 TaxID=2569543 RepID=UPI0010ADB3CE|nr:pentapeptide repeat-containing protein [Desulforhopalus sp. IMCC35007]TKB10307.1 hypothetical protein FCL48_07100 [Desulforhopalus sp. IMCC35007]
MKKTFFYLGCAAVLVAAQTGNGHAAPSVTATENLAKLVATRSCRGCELSGINFNRMDLSKVDLEGADLSTCSFLLTNLSYANLKNTILHGAVFGGADLGDADLTGADLRGVSFDSAYLGGTKMSGEIVTTKPFESIGVDEVEKDVYVEDPAIPKKTPQQQEVKVGERRDFNDVPPVAVTKKAATPAPVTEIKSVEVSAPPETAVPQAPPAKKSSFIEQASVPETISDAVKERGDDAAVENEVETVTETTVPEEPVPPAVVETKVVPGKTVPRVAEVVIAPEITDEPAIPPVEIDKNKLADLEVLLDTKRCFGCDLSGLDISGKNLEDADLEKANLSGANLERTDLEGVNLKGALLVGANLKKANLKNADLYKANLTGADLTGANQKNVSFDNALLDGSVGVEMSLMLKED